MRDIQNLDIKRSSYGSGMEVDVLGVQGIREVGRWEQEGFGGREGRSISLFQFYGQVRSRSGYGDQFILLGFRGKRQDREYRAVFVGMEVFLFLLRIGLVSQQFVIYIREVLGRVRVCFQLQRFWWFQLRRGFCWGYIGFRGQYSNFEIIRGRRLGCLQSVGLTGIVRGKTGDSCGSERFFGCCDCVSGVRLCFKGEDRGLENLVQWRISVFIRS